jgi:hypothetical protein
MLTLSNCSGKRVNVIEGVGYFKDMARGRLSGSEDGFLKIVAIEQGKVRSISSSIHRITRFTVLQEKIKIA